MPAHRHESHDGPGPTDMTRVVIRESTGLFDDRLALSAADGEGRRSPDSGKDRVDVAAVDAHRAAGGRGGEGRGEVDDQVGDLLGFDEAL